MEKHGDVYVKVTAIIALCVLGTTALLKGIDHFILFTIAVIIGGIAGYEFRGLMTRMRH